MTWIELERKQKELFCGNGSVFIGRFVEKIVTWNGKMEGIHWMKMEEKMDLIELWIE